MPTICIINEKNIRRIETGARVHQYELAVALSALLKKNKLGIVFLSHKSLVKSEFKKQVPTLEFGGRPAFVQLARKLVASFHQIDLLYAREENVITTMLAMLFRRPMVVEANGLRYEEYSLQHGGLLARLVRACLFIEDGMIFRTASAVVAVTPYLAKAIVENHNVDITRTHFIPNGVDCAKFTPRIPPLDRSALGARPTDRLVLFAGSFQVWHGVLSFVSVAKRLGPMKNSVRFLLVGSGPMLRELIDTANKSGLKRAFVRVGPIEHEKMPALINAVDLCLFTPNPSSYIRRIGLCSIKVLEYLASGKPVLCFRVPGLDDILREGGGFLVDPGDVRGLAEHMTRLLRNPEELRTVGLAARQIACTHYDWKILAPKVVSVAVHASRTKPNLRLRYLLASPVLLSIRLLLLFLSRDTYSRTWVFREFSRDSI
ncbi:MAG: glycosyltransferase family 4 protein [Candidatus Bathyarchaeia archaeon]